MFLKCSDGDGQEGRGAGRQAPPPSFSEWRAAEGRGGTQGASWASASPRHSQRPAHRGIRIPGLQHKRPFPPNLSAFLLPGLCDPAL